MAIPRPTSATRNSTMTETSVTYVRSQITVNVFRIAASPAVPGRLLERSLAGHRRLDAGGCALREGRLGGADGSARVEPARSRRVDLGERRVPVVRHVRARPG